MTVQELYDSVGGSYESAKRTLQMDKLIARFIVKLLDDKSFDRLMAAGESHDPTALFEGAHAMKGVCANLGLDSLSAKASDLAEEFRAGNARKMDDAEVDRRLADIREQYESTVAKIREFAAAQ